MTRQSPYAWPTQPSRAPQHAAEVNGNAVMRGRAHRVAHPAEFQIVRHDAAIWPWPGGDRDLYVRIIPDTITGRRIESR